MLCGHAATTLSSTSRSGVSVSSNGCLLKPSSIYISAAGGPTLHLPHSAYTARHGSRCVGTKAAGTESGFSHSSSMSPSTVVIAGSVHSTRYWAEEFVWERTCVKTGACKALIEEVGE